MNGTELKTFFFPELSLLPLRFKLWMFLKKKKKEEKERKKGKKGKPPPTKGCFLNPFICAVCFEYSQKQDCRKESLLLTLLPLTDVSYVLEKKSYCWKRLYSVSLQKRKPQINCLMLWKKSAF